MTDGTDVVPLVDDCAHLETTAMADTERWEHFKRLYTELARHGDTQMALVRDETLWNSVFAEVSPKVQAKLSTLRMRLLASIELELQKILQVVAKGDECQYKHFELLKNVTNIVYRAIEGYLAYRPPPFAGVAHQMELRIDMFNPSATGELQPHADGPPDVNEGYGDPAVEAMQGIERPRGPLAVSPDLIVDPTDILRTTDL